MKDLYQQPIHIMEQHFQWYETLSLLFIYNLLQGEISTIGFFYEFRYWTPLHASALVLYTEVAV